MRNRIIPLFPPRPRAPSRRYSNQVYKWKWIALYTFRGYIYIYIRILDRIPKYSIGRQSDEEAFVWTLDSLDWVFRDIIIYVDDSRLVWSLRNCCRYFLNIVPRILWLFVIRSSKVKNSLLILYVLLIYNKKIRFMDKKKKYVQQIEIYMYIFVKK